jgi:arylsulfatase A-like enzyme
MDAHEPYSPSEEAINRFAPDTPENELPTGESGTEINKLLSSGAEGIEEKVKNMYKLYKASIWDMDRTLARTVELMLEQETTVIITADHGYQVDRDHPMEENRINVPLIIIDPNKSKEKERISTTVNIRSLPKTSVQKADLDKNLFDGADLLNISEDQVSITEGFTKKKDNEFLVDVQGSDQNEYLYHAAVIEGDDKITTVGGDIEIWNNTSEESELTDLILELQENSKINQTEDEIQYDDVTKQRLKELGYM